MKNRRVITLCLAIICLICSYEVQAMPIQWQISAGGNGHWYEAVYSQNGTWDDAQNVVNSMSGGWHLATITSQQENDFILSLFEDDPDYWAYAGYSSLVGDVYAGPWIGAISSSLSNNDWQWVTGEAFSYSGWGPYEPFRNGDRVYFSQFGTSSNIGWNDVPNFYTSPGYIIEADSYDDFASVPEPSTLLLIGSGLVGLCGARKKNKLF